MTDVPSHEANSFGSPALAGVLSGLTEASDWRTIFSGYSHIVLVANSGTLDIPSLKASFPETTLFVFFNKVYKTLDEKFDRHAVLVSRGQPGGANIVRRNEVDDVLAFFDGSPFLGILNIRLSNEERLNTSADYKGAATAHLDLAGFYDSFYTEGKTPTSGFAIALWLSEMSLPSSIVLAGFSGKRTEKWRVVAAHDWSYEQTFLRLFARRGKILFHEGVSENPYAVLSERFPDIPAHEIALAASEILSERLSATDAQVDKLISLTGLIRAGDRFLRGLKPRLLGKRRS